MNTKTKQKYLKQLGYYNMNIDGKYGPGTIMAVRRFQEDNRLQVDGKCGPITQTRLKNIIRNGFKIGKVYFLYTRLNGSVEEYMIDEEQNLSKNFKVKEFLMHGDSCKKAGITESERLTLVLNEQILIGIQKLRDRFGSITINSGYRNEKYCLSIGSTATSKHIRGMAIDFACNNIPVYKAYIRSCNKSLNIFGMENNTKGYIHIECYRRNGNKLIEFNA